MEKSQEDSSRCHTRFPPDVQQLVRDHIDTGHYASEDDVLREALRALTHEEDDLAAIREAVADVEGGDAGIPLEDVVRSLRNKYDITEPT